MSNKLDYYNGTNEVPEGSFRISASSISKFFYDTRQWWGENLLEEEGFLSSTSSVLGTCVHYVAEMYGKNKEVSDEDKLEIEKYITQEASKNESIDAELIREQYKVMGENLINSFIISNPPTHQEEFMYKEILPGIGVGGSNDYFNEKTGTVADYKTTSSLTAPTSISYPYRLQLLVYAWLYQQRGFNVNRIQIVYVTRNTVGRVSEKTGKPMKDYPTTVKVLSEQVTEEDMEFIESVINIVADSVKTWKEKPELRYLLAQDYRLKEAPKKVEPIFKS